jgi:hypothetical protein
MPGAQTRKRAAKKVTPTKKAQRTTVEDDELDDLDVVDIEVKDSITAIYDVEKETAGTWRYKERVEEGELPVTATLYLKKTSVRELGEPAVITVTIAGGAT